MEFQYGILSNPEIFAVGRLMAHSDHEFTDETKGSLGRISLNGTWQFCYAEQIEEIPEGFESPEYDCSSWAQIQVPGHLQLQGYGAPQYANVQYPWDGSERLETGEVPKKNPVGCYVREIELDAQPGLVYISFQGVESAFALYLNGSFVGYSEDSFTPSEFYLTPFLREGKNKLAVKVFRYATGSWLEDQDFFRFSGIFRDVWLFTKPACHLEDLFVKTKLTEAYRKAEIKLCMRYEYHDEQQAGAYAQYQLTDPSGAVIVQSKAEITGQRAANQTVSVEQFQSADVYTDELLMQVEEPVLWSAEQPALYTLTIAIHAQDGSLLESVNQKIGIREFAMRNAIMELNGKRIVLRGVNRHEFCVDGGRVLPKELQKQDVVTMKRNHINAVRTSHYPNASIFYELCDSYGIYMIDETNLETHGTWQNADESKRAVQTLPRDRKEWLGAVLDRANSLFQRDKNHPAVLFWSCGNESSGGLDIYQMSCLFHAKDDSRLVHYEGIMWDNRYPDTSDVISRMYWHASDIAAYLKEHREKPFISCEFAHSMGNSTGNFAEYTELTETEPLYQGGFIWDFVDQAITATAPNGEKYPGYGGDFEDRPHDADFSGDGILFFDRSASPKLAQVKYDYQPFRIQVKSDRFILRNDSLFENTDAYRFEAILTCDGRELRRDEVTIHVNAGEEGVCLLPYDAALFAEKEPIGEYLVTISMTLRQSRDYAEAGYEVAFGQSEGFGKCKSACACVSVVSDMPVLIETDFNVGVTGICNGQPFQYLFAKSGQGFCSMKVGGKEYLKNGLRPNFWRAPVQNDNGNGMPMKLGQWKLISAYHETRLACASQDTQSGIVTVTYDYSVPYYQKKICQLVYEVYRTGEIRVTMQTEGCPELPDMPEFGVICSVPLSYDRLSWYGRGPQETYADRKSGSRIGQYQNRVKENVAPYILPQETGNHTDVRYASVTDEAGDGILLQAAGEMQMGMNVNATPYLPEQLEIARHHFELPQPYQTVVRISGAQMGVGGDDSWGAPVHEPYLLHAAEPRAFSFVLSAGMQSE